MKRQTVQSTSDVLGVDLSEVGIDLESLDFSSLNAIADQLAEDGVEIKYLSSIEENTKVMAAKLNDAQGITKEDIISAIQNIQIKDAEKVEQRKEAVKQKEDTRSKIQDIAISGADVKVEGGADINVGGSTVINANPQSSQPPQPQFNPFVPNFAKDESSKNTQAPMRGFMRSLQRDNNTESRGFEKFDGKTFTGGRALKVANYYPGAVDSIYREVDALEEKGITNALNKVQLTVPTSSNSISNSQYNGPVVTNTVDEGSVTPGSYLNKIKSVHDLSPADSNFGITGIVDDSVSSTQALASVNRSSETTQNSKIANNYLMTNQKSSWKTARGQLSEGKTYAAGAALRVADYYPSVKERADQELELLRNKGVENPLGQLQLTVPEKESSEFNSLDPVNPFVTNRVDDGSVTESNYLTRVANMHKVGLRTPEQGESISENARLRAENLVSNERTLRENLHKEIQQKKIRKQQDTIADVKKEKIADSAKIQKKAEILLDPMLGSSRKEVESKRRAEEYNISEKEYTLMREKQNEGIRNWETEMIKRGEMKEVDRMDLESNQMPREEFIKIQREKAKRPQLFKVEESVAARESTQRSLSEEYMQQAIEINKTMGSQEKEYDISEKDYTLMRLKQNEGIRNWETEMIKRGEMKEADRMDLESNQMPREEFIKIQREKAKRPQLFKAEESVAARESTQRRSSEEYNISKAEYSQMRREQSEGIRKLETQMIERGEMKEEDRTHLQVFDLPREEFIRIQKEKARQPQLYKVDRINGAVPNFAASSQSLTSFDSSIRNINDKSIANNISRINQKSDWKMARGQESAGKTYSSGAALRVANYYPETKEMLDQEVAILKDRGINSPLSQVQLTVPDENTTTFQNKNVLDPTVSNRFDDGSLSISNYTKKIRNAHKIGLLTPQKPESVGEHARERAKNLVDNEQALRNLHILFYNQLI